MMMKKLEIVVRELCLVKKKHICPAGKGKRRCLRHLVKAGLVVSAWVSSGSHVCRSCSRGFRDAGSVVLDSCVKGEPFLELESKTILY